MNTLPGSSSHKWTLLRVPAGEDTEGNPHRTPVAVASGLGAFGYASAREKAYAARAGAEYAARLTINTSTPCPAQEGEIVEVNGDKWRVATVERKRLHLRLLLSSTSSQAGA